MSTTTTMPTPVTLTTEQATITLYALLRHVADWYEQVDARTDLTNNDVEELASRAGTLEFFAYALARQLLVAEVASFPAAKARPAVEAPTPE